MEKRTMEERTIKIFGSLGGQGIRLHMVQFAWVRIIIGTMMTRQMIKLQAVKLGAGEKTFADFLLSLFPEKARPPAEP